MADHRVKRTSMSCRSCGYVLDGLGASTAPACPECGEGFDPHDAATFHRILDDPVRLARLPIAEAVAACMALEQAGIHATVEREQSGIIGHVDLPRGAVWVSRCDADDARRTLSELVVDCSQQQPWTCPACAEEVEADFDVCWNCQGERDDHAPG